MKLSEAVEKLTTKRRWRGGGRTVLDRGVSGDEANVLS
jgi:hypothetical protein